MTRYDQIGTEYDNTRRADPYLARRVAENLKLQTGQRYLDLACGTGNYTMELARRPIRVIGADQSRAMIAAAKTKSWRALNINWIIADAESLPLADVCLMGVVCFLAHHHFQNVDQAFAEVFRVLVSSGRFVIFNTAPDQLRGFWLAAYFPRVMEQAIESCEQLDTERRLEKAGFSLASTELYEVSPGLQDCFLYCGKHDPSRYLDVRVRAGISAFSSPLLAKEIDQGCRRLAADIGSGRFNEIAQSYRNDRGDYTFWIAGKMPSAER